MESKNTVCEAHLRGHRAEEKVADFFRQKKYKILKQRWRSPFAEVDLVVESPSGGIGLIEIKTISHFDFINVRISEKQKQRLQRAHLFVQSKTKRPVVLYLALVNQRGQILFFENF